VAKQEESKSPRRPRPSGASQRRAAANPYNTVAASKRRAERIARSGGTGRRAPGIENLDALEAAEAALRGEPRPTKQKRQADPNHLDQETIADILAHPTKFVSEDELRSEYAYVLNDIRSMALLALGLVVLLVVLASVLPTAIL
jgi:hypothetical protein